MQKKLSTIFLACLSLSTLPALSCTRMLHVDANQGVMVGRNMDWVEDMNTKLIVYPRGIARQGNTAANPLTWVSKYGSIVATSYDIGSADGMNEAGLAVHGLWLDETDYGPRNTNVPGLSLMAASNFYLDNFKTVDEAIRFTESGAFQITPLNLPGSERMIKVHVALEDATGDSAIIEYIHGVPKIYHSKEYTVLTNDPVYNVQLDNLKQYQGFGGNKPLPGTEIAADRFVRASFYGSRLPSFPTTKDAVAGIFSVMQNVVAPHAAIRGMPGKIHSTIWRTVSDLTHHVYYFNSTPNMTTVYAQLDKFNLQPGTPVMKLDLVKRNTLSGDVSGEFEAVK